MAAILDEKIFCCHGGVHTCVDVCTFNPLNITAILGLSPDLQSMEQIRRIMRPTDVPDQGLLCDLLWADPDKETLGWGENDRGVSFTFGTEIVSKFLTKHDLDLICRAHQVCTLGVGRLFITAVLFCRWLKMGMSSLQSDSWLHYFQLLIIVVNLTMLVP